MKKPKNNLDERQEQVLLKIEHNGCWLAFWGLLVVMIVEKFIFGIHFKYTVGESMVLMALIVYMAGACLKNGIWDRHLKPNVRTNAIVSLIAAVVFGGVMSAFAFSRFSGIVGAVASGFLSAAMVFISCFVLLQLTTKYYKKRRKQLEAELEDNFGEADESKG